jgi:hypothetical protein
MVTLAQLEPARKAVATRHGTVSCLDVGAGPQHCSFMGSGPTPSCGDT